MKYLMTLLGAMLLVFVAPVQASGRGEPIVNFENQVIKRFDNKVLSMEDVEKGIRAGADKAGWRVEPAGPGHIIATLVVRARHTAVVDITYSRESYSIKYKNSDNLGYRASDTSRPMIDDTGSVTSSKEPVIHPNYNKWVQRLNDAIFRELQQ